MKPPKNRHSKLVAKSALADQRELSRESTPEPSITARFAVASSAPELGKQDIVETRESLRLSQPVFAAVLNVSSETVKAWEQGKRVPDKSALRLLQLLRMRPEWVMEVAELELGNQSGEKVRGLDQLGGRSR